MPFDPPFALPRREPEPRNERLLRQALAYPGFREATCELIEASATELGLARPVGRAGFEVISNHPAFRQRLEALVTAVLW